MAGRVLQPLEDSYQAQRQFVANASHELRAPLTRLRALIEVALASSEANFASLRKAHERVLASEQHLEQLIDALLALTRGQAGLGAPRATSTSRPSPPRPCSRTSQSSRGLDLDVRATLDPAPTAGDPRLLERLIANLIDNAIRHNTPGGHVEITTGTRDRHAFVSIANTGPTVPPEEIQRLFQPFQRLDGARTRHNNGHGLGLSIVQAIANAHRAELSARARPRGRTHHRSLIPAGNRRQVRADVRHRPDETRQPARQPPRLTLPREAEQPGVVARNTALRTKQVSDGAHPTPDLLFASEGCAAVRRLGGSGGALRGSAQKWWFPRTLPARVAGVGVQGRAELTRRWLARCRSRAVRACRAGRSASLCRSRPRLRRRGPQCPGR